jgi:hypothetical protein
VTRSIIAMLAFGVAVSQPPKFDIAECMTFSLYKAFSLSPKASSECCGECGGKGVVLSGDGISWVSCPCPDDCECKKNAAEVSEDAAGQDSCPGGRCKR